MASKKRRRTAPFVSPESFRGSAPDQFAAMTPNGSVLGTYRTRADAEAAWPGDYILIEELREVGDG